VLTRRWLHSRFGGLLVRELALVVALLLVYKYGRFLGKDHVDAALRNARDVIGIERTLGVFSEARLQDLVLSDTALIRFLNIYYLAAHVAVTAAAFVWLYVRHPATYRRFRNVMVVITLTGMAGHLLMPLAPPRMFPHLGFVDTARTFGPASYGAGSPYKGFANEFAAMPSLHFGWAVVIAWAVLIATTSRWRYLVILHPVMTLAAIVLTANHYWLDAFVATVLFAFALGVDWLLERRRKRHAEVRARADARTVEPAAQLAPASSDSPSTYRPRAPRAPAGSPAANCRRTRSPH
jgi:PAP2 superfamily